MNFKLILILSKYVLRNSGLLLLTGLLFFLFSCKKDESSGGPGSQSNEYNEYLSNDQAWDSLPSGIKFIRIQPTGPSVDFSVKTEVYLKSGGSSAWEQLPYLFGQNINIGSTGNPVLFYVVKLEYDWILPYSIVYIYARPGASIDFSKTVSIRVRKYL